MSDHGHPSARQRHEDHAFERVLAARAERALAELAGHEQRVRASERRRIAAVLVADSVETDFEGCVG